MNTIELTNTKIENNRIDFSFKTSEKLQKYFRTSNYLFYEYNHDISKVPLSIISIPFVANVIPLVWITNSRLIIDELDKSFFYCLERVRVAYQDMFPNVKFMGEIVVRKLVENSYNPEVEAASLFSGGVDALTTVIRNIEKDPILITEYCWYEEEITHNEVWESDKKNALLFGENHGLSNILIQSNFGTFIKASKIDYDFQKKLGDTWWHGLHHSLALISASIPVAYKLKVKCIYIASSFFKGYKAKCASDPTVDNEIRFASGKVFHDGYELNRQKKIELIVNSEKVKSELRVCFKNEGNCCKCEKCMRTVVGIIAEGKDPINYGFELPGNYSQYIQSFLNENIKFFTPSQIMQWELAQTRMLANKDIEMNYISFKWFLDFNFIKEKKRTLLEYRLKNFFPIIKRKIKYKYNDIFVNN